MIKKVLKKGLHIMLTIQMIIAIILCAILFIPTIFGFRTYAVMSDSMYPELKKGYVVFVDTKVEPDSMEVGDIIAFNLTPETCAIHRAVEKSDKSYVTKGDLNASKDVAPVYFNNVIGLARGKIPVIGYIQMFFMTLAGKITGFSIILFDIILYILLLHFSGLKDELESKEKTEVSAT